MQRTSRSGSANNNPPSGVVSSPSVATSASASIPVPIDRISSRSAASGVTHDFIQLSSSRGTIAAIPMDHLSTSIRSSFDLGEDDVTSLDNSTPSSSSGGSQQREHKHVSSVSSPLATPSPSSSPSVAAAASSSSGKDNAGPMMGSAGVTTANGVSPLIASCSEEEVALSNSVLRIKILIALLLVISLVTLQFFSRGDWKVILAGITLIIFCCIGLRGAFRSDARFLRVFWTGLYVWSALFVACIAIFLASNQLDPFVQTRCQQSEFLNKGNFGVNCTVVAANPCFDNCVAQVNTQLIVEVTGFSALIGLLMLIFANSAKQLATDLLPITQPAGVVDEETPRHRSDDDASDGDADSDGEAS